MYSILLIPPLLFFTFSIWLNSDGFWLILFLSELPLLSAILEKRGKIRPKKWFRVFSYSLLLLFFLGYIILIPDTMYHGWMALLERGKHGGNVSLSFIIPVTVFASLGCSRLVLAKNGLTEILNLILMINIIILIMLPKLPVILLFGILLFLIMMRNIPHKERRKILHFLFILILLAGGAGRFIVPGDIKPSGSRTVDRLSRGLHSGLLDIFPGLPLLFHVPGYGYAHETTGMTGGKPLLSSIPLFTVSGRPGEIIYLRTDTSRNYGGTGWMITAPEKPGIPKRPNIIPGPENSPETIEITLLGDLFTRVPVTPETVGYELDNFYYTVEQTVNSAGILPPGLPLSRGDSFTLFTGTPAAASGFDRRGETEAEGSAPASEEPSDPEAESTGLSARDVPADIIRLAEKLGEGNPEIILKRISKFLSDEYTYTLETEKSAAPVSDFLFNTRRGYCVHFATAGALLAGLNGLPVRMARGFLVKLPGDTGMAGQYPGGETQDIPGRTLVSGFSAHMWPEVLDGNGRWVPWEVTPPMADPSGGGPGLTGDDPLTRNQLERFGLLRESEGIQDEDGNPEEGVPAAGRGVLAAAATAAVLLSLLIFILSRKIADRCRPGRVYRRIALRIKRRHKIPMPDEIGWIEWGRRAAQIQPDKIEELDETINAILRSVYGGNTNRNNAGKLSGLFKIKGKFRNQTVSSTREISSPDRP